MGTATIDVEQLVQQAVRLPALERVRLIQLVAETLIESAKTDQSTGLWRYGAFSGGKMSTEEDFLIAEWRPTDEELDGP